MNKTKLKGDRFGGIVFDIQQHRRGERIMVPKDTRMAVQRETLIHTISTLIGMVEDIDDLEFTPIHGLERQVNILKAAAAVYDRCEEPDHDRFGQRKTDCTECPQELSPSLEDMREPPRMATICKCEAPNCNSTDHYPKACYSCGGIVVKP